MKCSKCEGRGEVVDYLCKECKRNVYKTCDRCRGWGEEKEQVNSKERENKNLS